MIVKKITDKNRTALYEATIPFKDISARFEVALKKIAEQAEIEGFRKGKAPLDIVRTSTSKERVYDKLIQDLIPDIYKQAIEMDKLRPFLSPKVELKKAQEDQDWVIQLSIALEPTIKLADYKKIVKDVKADSKKDDIWIPGKDETEKADAQSVEKREKFLNQVLKKLIDETSIEISDLLIEEEINVRLSRLVDDIRKIGLTIEAYLSSRKTTQEKLREEFIADILNTYKLEYALNAIGDKENITVEKEEIDKLLNGITNPAEKAEAEKNAYVYSMMIRKQKIVDFLGSL